MSGPRVRATRADGRCCASGCETESGLRTHRHRLHVPGQFNYLTSLGHSVFLADLVHDACTGNWQTARTDDGNPLWNVEGFLDQALNFSGRKFDVVLLWTALDYLPEALSRRWWRICLRP